MDEGGWIAVRMYNSEMEYNSRGHQGGKWLGLSLGLRWIFRVIQGK